MWHVNIHGEPRPVESSVVLLRGVQMSPAVRGLAIVQMRRAEALVDLAFRAAAWTKPTLHRLARGARAGALIVKGAFQAPASAGSEKGYGG